MVFFNFRLNTSEEEKRKQIRLHAAAGTADIAQFLSFPFDTGIYFKKYDKLIAGFYHLSSQRHRRLSFSTTPSWRLADHIFIGKIIHKEGIPYCRGMIFTAPFQLLLSIFFILMTIFYSPYISIAAILTTIFLIVYQHKCYQLLKDFFSGTDTDIK